MQKKQRPFFEGKHIKLESETFCLNDIHFALPSGYILGVVGRNGVGKSSLIKAILGEYENVSCTDKQFLEQEDKPSMTFYGEFYLHAISQQDIKAYRKQIAYVLCDTPFPLRMSAKDCGKLYGAYYPGFDMKKYREYLKEFEVPQHTVLKNLSQGQKVRQQLAFSLSYNAILYVLDEPTGNLDVKFRETFYQKIRELIKDGTKSVLYVSHLVEELEPFVDYVLWIEKEKKDNKVIGKQKYFGTWESLQETYQILETNLEKVIQFLPKETIVGMEKRTYHEEILVRIKKEQLPLDLQMVCRYPTIKEIMYYHAKERNVIL